MFGFGLIRLYSVIVRKERDYLFYDSLLFAGIAYVFAIFILHLTADYYFLPAIILFLPSLVHWTKYLFERKRVFAAALFIILLPLYINNYGQTAAQIKGIWWQRQEFMPYITNLLSEYNDGNKFIWYESDNRITDNTFYTDVRNWRKHVENAFLNYLNKSEEINFFATEKSMECITVSQNMLFFYPVDNDQNQPMRDELVKTLRDNNFALYKDLYGVLIYKQH
jgi:ABC-type multidrug transport system fused ATPase/permease subunit